MTKKCPIRMVEIYSGQIKEWKGWHNLVSNDDEGYAIAGPLNPTLSKPLLEVIEFWNKHNTNEDTN